MSETITRQKIKGRKSCLYDTLKEIKNWLLKNTQKKIL